MLTAKFVLSCECIVYISIWFYLISILFGAELRALLRLCSGVTSHREPRQCRRARGPKTVNGAQSDPNYVS